MYCNNCGEENEDGAKFCNDCGNSLSSDELVVDAPRNQTTDELVLPEKSIKVFIQRQNVIGFTPLSICAFFVIVAYFLPWASIGGRSLSGYQINQLPQPSDYALLFWYLVMSVPILGLFMLVSGSNKILQSRLSILTGTVLLTIVVWLLTTLQIDLDSYGQVPTLL